MTRMMLVEQYFYPDGWGGAEIPRDIAIAISQAGIDVEVLCGADQYAPMPPGAAAQDPRSYGVKVLRIPRIIPGPVRRFRMLRVLWFCLCAAPVLLFRRRIELIVTQTNPPLIVPTVAFVTALRRTPFVIIAQDVFPEALFASGAATPDTLVGRCLMRLFSWSYCRADYVVVLGSFMQRRIRAKGVSPDRIVTISNWATGEIRRQYGQDNPLRSKWGLQNRFVVLYSGNIGVGHEFETFLAGVKIAAATRAELTVVFIGGGSRLAEVQSLARTLGLDDRVIFQDFVPAEALPLSMGIADLALVTLRGGFEGVIVPSKLLGYMARGIPTLYVGPDSDVAEMIQRADCGACCGTGQSDRVAEALCGAMNFPDRLRCWSENGRAFYVQHLSRELAVRRYLDLTRDAIKPTQA
jgi:putative colanic acid biosynthesis glycosyltransferase WcaI